MYVVFYTKRPLDGIVVFQMTCFQCIEDIVQIECCCTQEFSLISTTK